jgi:hypothetical protein
MMLYDDDDEYYYHFDIKSSTSPSVTFQIGLVPGQIHFLSSGQGDSL